MTILGQLLSPSLTGRSTRSMVGGARYRPAPPLLGSGIGGRRPEARGRPRLLGSAMPVAVAEPSETLRADPSVLVRRRVARGQIAGVGSMDFVLQNSQWSCSQSERPVERDGGNRVADENRENQQANRYGFHGGPFFRGFRSVPGVGQAVTRGPHRTRLRVRAHTTGSVGLGATQQPRWREWSDRLQHRTRWSPAWAGRRLSCQRAR